MAGQVVTHSWMRKVGRGMLIALSIILGIILIFAAVLWLISPGKIKPVVDETGKPVPGSLSEKVFINVNGAREGMFIQSRDTNHPVLLILHGGMPEFFLTETYPTGLENDFTVVWWEQRGSGMSYDASVPRETMTMEQMIEDTLTVTNYLRQRFNKEKIYLMGHSGGSFIGIQAAARAPELYYAYLGQAQMVNQLKSEEMAYAYMLEQYKASGDTRMVRQLEAAPVSQATGTPLAYRQLRDPAMHSLGIGTIHSMRSVVDGLVLASWRSPQYTLAEKFNLWRSKAQAGISIMWDTMIKTDLSQQVTEFAIPVYFFEGKYDYTCNATLARDYFDKIKAPVKGFYWFEQSAHSAAFEEPAKMRQILQQDVLVGANHLSDVK